MKTLKPDDILMFTQKNGNRIVVLVSNIGIQLKADNPGTVLEVTRHTPFGISTEAVDEIDKEKVITTIKTEASSLTIIGYRNILYEFNLKSFSMNSLRPLNSSRLESLLAKIREVENGQ